MSSNKGVGGPNAKMICDMDDHGIHGKMKNDAQSVAAAAVEVLLMLQIIFYRFVKYLRLKVL